MAGALKAVMRKTLLAAAVAALFAGSAGAVTTRPAALDLNDLRRVSDLMDYPSPVGWAASWVTFDPLDTVSITGIGLLAF